MEIFAGHRMMLFGLILKFMETNFPQIDFSIFWYKCNSNLYTQGKKNQCPKTFEQGCTPTLPYPVDLARPTQAYIALSQ
jgi:hypothetical protein